MKYTLMFVKDKKDNKWGFYGLYWTREEAEARKKELMNGEMIKDYILQDGEFIKN